MRLPSSGFSAASVSRHGRPDRARRCAILFRLRTSPSHPWLGRSLLQRSSPTRLGGDSRARRRVRSAHRLVAAVSCCCLQQYSVANLDDSPTSPPAICPTLRYPQIWCREDLVSTLCEASHSDPIQPPRPMTPSVSCVPKPDNGTNSAGHFALCALCHRCFTGEGLRTAFCRRCSRGRSTSAPLPQKGAAGRTSPGSPKDGSAYSTPPDCSRIPREVADRAGKTTMESVSSDSAMSQTPV